MLLDKTRLNNPKSYTANHFYVQKCCQCADRGRVLAGTMSEFFAARRKHPEEGQQSGEGRWCLTRKASNAKGAKGVSTRPTSRSVVERLVT